VQAGVRRPGRRPQALALAEDGVLQVDPELVSVLVDSAFANVIVALDSRQLREAEAEAEVADGSAWPDAVFAAQEAALRRLPPGSFELTRRFKHVPALAGRLSEGGLSALAAIPEVTAVAVDPRLELYLAESVPFIGADVLHRRHRITGKGVTVAVLDTGTDTNNIDLRDAIVDEACIIDPPTLCPAPPHVSEDIDGHGTAVAGIIASRGRQSSDGVAPAVSIVSVKALEERNNAVGSALVAALDWVLDRGDVAVVNMSLGGGGYSDYCDDASAYTKSLAAVIKRLNASGTVVIAASGNKGSTTLVGSPACIRGAVSVGAVQDFADNADFDPKLAQFTNRNATLDLLAPGVGVVAPSIRGQPSSFGGTSAAAPHVAGAAALLMEAAPWAAPDLIVELLKEHGKRPHLRYGRLTIRTIDVKAAYDALRRITPTATGSAPPSPSATPTASEPVETATPTLSYPTPTSSTQPATASPSDTPTSRASDTPDPTASSPTGETPTPTGDAPTATAESPPTLLIYLPAAQKP
jgi:subtilisin family serine protease